MGVEGLLRYDHLEPNEASRRPIASGRSPASPTGSRTRATSSTALLLDYEQVEQLRTSTPAQPTAEARRRARARQLLDARLDSDGAPHATRATRLRSPRCGSPSAVAVVVPLAVTVAAQTVQINGAGATFPYPIYSKWFSEYNKLQPERPDQLPVDRLGRRHPPDHEPDGVLRRHRRPDDRRPAAGGAGHDPALPDRARRRRARLQHPRRGQPS